MKEFKKHGITVEQLKNTLDNTKNQYLKLKLNDMYIMYNQYEEEIASKFIDEEDTLSILAESLDKTEMFKDSIIYIDEFVGYTKQEYDIIRKLLKQAKQVNITVCMDTSENTINKEQDLFIESRETFQKLINIAKEEKINIEKAVELNEIKKYKTLELKHLEKNLYNIKYEKYINKVENIELFLAKNQFTEIENVAKEIVRLVRDNGLRYKEISVITKTMDTYSKIIKAIFNKYDIPVYIDEKKDLSQNILIKYVLSIIEIFSKNWSYEAVFNYLKTGLSGIDMKDIFALENYCLKYGIRGSKWYKEPWKVAKNDEELKFLNDLREKIVKPLLEFKDNLNRVKNAKEITEKLYKFLIENKIDEELINKANVLEKNGEIALANLYRTSWNTLINVLDEVVLVLKEDKISFEEYVKVLKIGLQNSGLGSIPTTLDQVIVGDVERSRTHEVKVAFIIGLNDGVFPKLNKDEGFLNDNDREYLKENGIELAKGSKDLLFEENFNIYKALLVPEEKLYLSYASCDNLGKSLRPSMLISKIKKIFVKLTEKSDIVNSNIIITNKKATFEELLENIRKYEDKEEIDSIWFDIYNLYKKNPEYKEKLESAIVGLNYTNKPENLSKENIDNLYKNVLNTSISRLEQYKRCAFSYYLKYGLGLTDKSLFKIESLDTGTFMHDVIDEFFEQVLSREISLKNITDEEISEIVSSIINEKLTLNRNYIFTGTAKYRILTTRLKNVILKSMKYIIKTITESDFEIFGNEVEFKNGKKYKPIIIELEDGKKVEITGKIDRIDLAKNKDGKYMRIIDYKSSVKNIDLNEFIAGLQIQLLTYLDAVSKIEDVIPAGVLYFNLIDPIIKADKNMSDEEIELELKKQFKMQGLILADINVVRMMDNNLDKGASNIIPAYIDKDNNLSNTRSNCVNKEQFKYLQRYTNKLIKEIANEILSGNIDIRPTYNRKKKKTPCEYCEYKSICNFDSTKNEYNYVPDLDKEVILDMIKGDI
ncbi:MAG: helicase-exonuclease AddAB subunit AddB [Clostridia bacterium]|nr:helicase-exonuclease AddAB subunit AddB [Clostridia bacterium]